MKKENAELESFDKLVEVIKKINQMEKNIGFCTEKINILTKEFLKYIDDTIKTSIADFFEIELENDIEFIKREFTEHFRNFLNLNSKVFLENEISELNNSIETAKEELEDLNIKFSKIKTDLNISNIKEIAGQLDSVLEKQAAISDKTKVFDTLEIKYNDIVNKFYETKNDLDETIEDAKISFNMLLNDFQKNKEESYNFINKLEEDFISNSEKKILFFSEKFSVAIDMSFNSYAEKLNHVIKENSILFNDFISTSEKAKNTYSEYVQKLNIENTEKSNKIYEKLKEKIDVEILKMNESRKKMGEEYQKHNSVFSSIITINIISFVINIIIILILLFNK